MKIYVKPTFEFIELRTEERLATCRASVNNHGHGIERHKCYNPNSKLTGHTFDFSKSGPTNGTPPAWGHCGPS